MGIRVCKTVYVALMLGAFDAMLQRALNLIFGDVLAAKALICPNMVSVAMYKVLIQRGRIVEIPIKFRSGLNPSKINALQERL
jgi:hypothetical protein